MQKYVEMIKHFNKLLSDDKTKEIGRKEKNCFVRKSKLGFNELIKYILSRTGKTTSNEINNYYSEIDKLEKSISKQSIFQAREKLNPEVFMYLNEEMIKHYYKNTKIEKEKGFILLSIDGTQLEMPLNDDTKEKFGISENHKWATQTKTLPRCSGLYDVLNNVYLNFKVNHITMAEIPMAYEQIKLTKNIISEEKCIFLADRNYGATDLFLLFDKLDYK